MHTATKAIKTTIGPPAPMSAGPRAISQPNNRPGAGQARQLLAAMADSPKLVAQRQLAAQVQGAARPQEPGLGLRPGNAWPGGSEAGRAVQAVVQRTRWQYTNDRWEIDGTRNKRAERYRAPGPDWPVADPQQGDRYNQATGQVTRSNQQRSLPIERSNPFSTEDLGHDYGGAYFDRQNTTYGVLGGDTSHQGPHTGAHVLKRVATEQAEQRGYQLHQVPQGTTLLPTPGQNRRLIKQYAAAAYGDKAEQYIPRRRRKIHDKIYQDRLEAAGTAPSAEEKNLYTAQAMELHGLATSHNGVLAPKSATKRKRESAQTATRDLNKLVNAPLNSLPRGIECLDPVTFPHAGCTSGRDALNPDLYTAYLHGFATFAQGGPPGKLEVESESEYSEMDTDTEQEYEKLRPPKKRKVSKGTDEEEEEEEEEKDQYVAPKSNAKNQVPTDQGRTRLPRKVRNKKK